MYIKIIQDKYGFNQMINYKKFENYYIINLEF